jgi:MFS transporter, CP family, cyanate transporter
MTSGRARVGPDRARAPSTLLLGVTLVLTALNLRAAVTSVGPVLRDIQADLAMSDTVAGILTSLPVLCFGVVGLIAARLGRRFGTERALVVSLVLITVGLVVRAVAPSVGWLLLTSLMALIGMAVGNILAPVVVKAWFPHEVGRYTGLYSMAVVLGTAVPVAITVPLAEALGGWRFGLGAWAVPALAALVPWLFVARRTPVEVATPATGSGGAPALAARIRRDPRAWALMVFFGIQSLEAYVVMGWLPTILQDAGLSPSRAGWTASLTLVLSVPVALIVPALAGRRPDQRPWIVLMTAASVLGYLGLLLAPASVPLLWAVLLGIGLGAFPLALLLIGLRATTSRGTSELSSLVQGYGYLLAATGPFAIGLLHDLTGGWELPLGALLVAIVPKLIGGLVAGAPGVVDADPSELSPP